MTTPSQTFPVTIESAWHGLMKQLGTKNIAQANAQKILARATTQLTKRR